MKRIVITGGAGFMGSHLCERLLYEGHNVICLDNFSTGTRENVAHLFDYNCFKLVKHDITKPFFTEAEEIYNLACPASPVQYRLNPIKTIKTSVIGSINMLNLAKRSNARILQASTSEIYGDPEIHPQREDYWGHVNPIGERSCYNEGKRCAESLFINYHFHNNVRIKIVRIFNTYGPRMQPDDGRVISNFIVQALQNKDITIYGDGSQTRSFQYISDLLNGIITMMGSNDSFTGPVNIGNPKEHSIRELAEKIIELTCSKSRIIFMPLPEDDPVQRQPDISLANKVLNGWYPEVDLDEGLGYTIAYFRKKITFKATTL
jgi:UDP-glucuronate decarboxylase